MYTPAPWFQLLPKNCAAQIAQSVNRKKNKDKRNRIIQEPEKPGSESFRKHREEFTRCVCWSLHAESMRDCSDIKNLWGVNFAGKKTNKITKKKTTCFYTVSCRMDKLHMALTELCYAINYCSVITVWEHGFVPREFFVQHLETRFNK